jgi:glycosyltransferase involved in cell wall biosynthesis
MARMNPKTRVAFVHNYATHYTAHFFELLSERCRVDFFFSSKGDEWFWPKQHGVRSGSFAHRLPRSFRIGRFRFAPSLAFDLWRGDYDVYVKSIAGRLELLTTYIIARVRRRPFVLWTGVWFRVDTLFHRLVFPIVRHIYRSADAIVVYGSHVKTYLISEGVDGERVFVAKLSVDNEAYSRAVSASEKATLRLSLEIDPDSKIVLFVGRLEEAKGLPYLLEALVVLRSTESLVVVGDGSLRHRCETLVSNAGLEWRVRFVGYVPISELPTYYAIASVTVLPSIATAKEKEPWGLVVNESFNQCVPVIATESVGAAAGGLIVDGKTGLVVKERSSVELARAIDLLLANDSLRKKIGESARARVRAWSHENMVDAFIEAIGSACRRDRA